MVARRWLVLFLLVSAVACRGRESAPAEPSATVTLAVITGLAGAADGCEAGEDHLARLAGRLEQLRAAGPFALLVAGDTFVADASSPVALFTAERRRAAAVARVLAPFEPIAIVRGPADLGAQAGTIDALGRELRLPLFAARSTPVPRLRVDTVLVERGGVRLGIVGTPGAAAGEVASYTAAALALRAQGAQLVLALLPERHERALAIARELHRIDVVVTGGSSGPPVAARLAGASLVVGAGSRGRALGLLRLHPRGGGAWTYDERGDEPMPPPQAPPGRSLTFTLEPVGPTQPEAPWAQALAREAPACAVTPR